MRALGGPEAAIREGVERCCRDVRSVVRLKLCVTGLKGSKIGSSKDLLSVGRAEVPIHEVDKNDSSCLLFYSGRKPVFIGT